MTNNIKITIISNLLTLYRIKLKVLTKVPLLSLTAIAAEELVKVQTDVQKLQHAALREVKCFKNTGMYLKFH